MAYIGVYVNTMTDRGGQPPVISGVLVQLDSGVLHLELVTDSMGWANFSDVPDGNYVLTLSKAGYTTRVENWTVSAAQYPSGFTISTALWPISTPPVEAGFPWWLLILLGLGIVLASEEKK